MTLDDGSSIKTHRSSHACFPASMLSCPSPHIPSIAQRPTPNAQCPSPPIMSTCSSPFWTPPRPLKLARGPTDLRFSLPLAVPFDLPHPLTFLDYTGIDPMRHRNEAKASVGTVINGVEIERVEDYFKGWCGAERVLWANTTAVNFLKTRGWDSNNAPGKAFRRLFENPAAAYSSMYNLGLAFRSPAGSSEKMIAVTCAISRVNAVIWVACFIIVFLAFYLTCCWPCLNLCSLGLYYCFCCGLVRALSPRRRKSGGGGGGGGALQDAEKKAMERRWIESEVRRIEKRRRRSRSVPSIGQMAPGQPPRPSQLPLPRAPSSLTLWEDADCERGCEKTLDSAPAPPPTSSTSSTSSSRRAQRTGALYGSSLQI